MCVPLRYILYCAQCISVEVTGRVSMICVDASSAAGGAALSQMATEGRFHEDVFGVKMSPNNTPQNSARLAGKQAEMLKLVNMIKADDAKG